MSDFRRHGIDRPRITSFIELAAVRAALASVCALVALAPAPARGAESGEEDEESVELRGGYAGEAGFGQIDEDYFLRIDLKLRLELDAPALVCPRSAPRESSKGGDCETLFRIDAQAPMRLRVIDEAPEDPDTLRREDWDEVSDYFRILRRLSYGRIGEPLYARFGELGAKTVGHGTVVNSYYNVITPDLFQPGLQLRTDFPSIGASAFVDNVVSPSVLVGRLRVSPGLFVGEDATWWQRLSFGVTAATDLDAPEALARRADGSVVVEPRRRPQVDSSQFTGIFGADVELRLIDSESLGLTSYTDFNVHAPYGSGLHAGVLVALQASSTVRLDMRLEFRALFEGYLPDYFGPLYAVHRYQTDGWGQQLPAPKLRIAATREGGPRPGAFGQLTASWSTWLETSVALAEHQGAGDTLFWLRARLIPNQWVQLALAYFKTGMDGLGEVVDPDGALFVSDARIRLVGPVYLHGQFERLFRLRDDGLYDSIDLWNVGLGASASF